MQKRLMCDTLALVACAVVLTLVGCGTVAGLKANDGVKLHCVGLGADGRNPLGNPVIDRDGNLYGTTYSGGESDDGTVFKITPDGAETVLHSFGTAADGRNPGMVLVMDRSGNLYGTTGFGGAYGKGTVFKITTDGTETTLHSFGTAHDGQYPRPELIMDSNGNLYGTMQYGGAFSAGGVFKISATGKETILHSFDTHCVGLAPWGELRMDNEGTLYGTTEAGGANCYGTVFKISAIGKETVLHSFGTGMDGMFPASRLLMDGAGNLYGTTVNGGEGDKGSHVGTLFKISATGKETFLHSFGTDDDGSIPSGGLVMDSAGNLYGTTKGGGANGYGTVFKISATGKETILHSFDIHGDGTGPWGELLMDNEGSLYGTTEYGGGEHAGTVFKLSNTGQKTILHSFHTPMDGTHFGARLFMDGAGNLYVTTEYDGTYGNGAVFKISASGEKTVLHSFGGPSKNGAIQ